MIYGSELRINSLATCWIFWPKWTNNWGTAKKRLLFGLIASIISFIKLASSFRIWTNSFLLSNGCLNQCCDYRNFSIRIPVQTKYQLGYSFVYLRNRHQNTVENNKWSRRLSWTVYYWRCETNDVCHVLNAYHNFEGQLLSVLRFYLIRLNKFNVFKDLSNNSNVVW